MRDGKVACCWLDFGIPEPAQLKEFFAQIDAGRITGVRLQAFLRSKADNKNVSTLLADWQDFYRDLFGLEMDLSGLLVPTQRAGFDRLIVVAPRMNPQRLYDKCAELFPCWKYTDDDLDAIVQSDYTAESGPYAVWFRDRIEADEELKNLSAYQLKEEGIPGITLEERLLMELNYFRETGKHLDIRNITLCSASRYSGGRVPGVYCGGFGLKVDWSLPDDARGCLRSRAAVR